MENADQHGGLSVERPSISRAYDYLLGGSHNFAVDRALAEEAIKAFPATGAAARANRSFLRRAVSYLVDHGCDQFLDLGSGIPTVGNVHEIAQAANPHTRVVYVDIEPIAVATARQVLADDPYTTAIEADLRDIDEILSHPEVSDTLDLSRPFAVLMVAVLHWIPDANDPAGIVARCRSVIPPGGYLTVSHLSRDDLAETGGMDALESVVADRSDPTTPRSRAWVEELFTDMQLIPPGVVHVADWRPDTPPQPEHSQFSWLGAIGRVATPSA